MLTIVKTRELQNTVLLSVTYQVLSAFALTIIGFQRKLLKDFPTPQLLIYRNVIQLMINMIIKEIMHNKSAYYIKNETLSIQVILRSFIGAFHAIIFYQGLILISLSEATILSCRTPLWTAIIMIQVLKIQKPSYSLLIEIFLCTLGVIFVVKPPIIFLIFQGKVTSNQIQPTKEVYHTLGVILMILCAIFFAVIQIMMNLIGKKVSTTIILHYSSGITTVVSAIVLVITRNQVKPSVYDILMIISMSLLGFIASALLNQSFAIGNVTQLSLVGNVQVIFSLFFDFLVLDSKIDFLSIIGTLIILGSLVFNTLVE